MISKYTSTSTLAAPSSKVGSDGVPPSPECSLDQGWALPFPRVKAGQKTAFSHDVIPNPPYTEALREKLGLTRQCSYSLHLTAAFCRTHLSIWWRRTRPLSLSKVPSKQVNDCPRGGVRQGPP